MHDIHLPLYGLHNLTNALGSIAGILASMLTNILSSDDKLLFEHQSKDVFKNFTGVEKRFSIMHNNHEWLIISDYAHHPTEISCLLQQYNSYSIAQNKVCTTDQIPTLKNLTLVFEPHREID